jgi:(1->4)-alpha-D-glucan 1-alpha-D-glucosylmutase
MSVPGATVRLQFNRTFTLHDALTVLDYYDDLGVSHFYASPLQCARSGSMHGYDIVDYTRINPELGGIGALRRLVAALRARGMGLILDIVPNHMATRAENRWWFDVLERGRDSHYAAYFDIDWDAPGLSGKLLAPFLAAPVEQALPAMTLRYRADDGRLLIEADGRRYPLSAETYPRVLPDPGMQAMFAEASRGGAPTHEALRDVMRRSGARTGIARQLARWNDGSPRAHAAWRELLERQHYRLVCWREAAARINWRRFFNISDLIALRMDRREVFDAVHAPVFRLYAEGLIDGVRVDHIDGIADPRAYCRWLREGLEKAGTERAPADAGAYTVVEKILAHDEAFRADWGVAGTTGYDFMDQSSAVLHDEDGRNALDALWRELGGETDFAEMARDTRHEAANTAFAADLDRFIRAWCAARRTDDDRPVPELDVLREAAVLLLEQFDVYRTYIEPGNVPDADREHLTSAATRAAAQVGPAQRKTLTDLLRCLLDTTPAAPARTALLCRFQQLTPAIAAKAIEDTAFYRYGRLLSRNEVGADPARLALSRSDFHTACGSRLAHTPDAMLATATHDHKRGEDVRARLAVLTELAESWSDALRGWRAANAPLRGMVDGSPAPRATDEAMLLETIAGSWPLELRADDADGLHVFAERLAGWQLKALREAKQATRWSDPNLAYESACKDYLHAALAPGRPALGAMHRFVERIAPAGVLNGLGMTVLRLTTPGVPDLYQGCDYWDLSLVDPDNRRAVDYTARRASLAAMHTQDMAALLRDWGSGRIKQTLIARLLRWRARHPEPLHRGTYRPLRAQGPLARQVIAFTRGDGAASVIVIVTRLATRYLDDGLPRIAPAHWSDTRVRVGREDGAYRDLFTARVIRSENGAIALRDALALLPVAVLVRDQGPRHTLAHQAGDAVTADVRDDCRSEIQARSQYVHRMFTPADAEWTPVHSALSPSVHSLP